jgi:hypothetical protein
MDYDEILERLERLLLRVEELEKEEQAKKEVRDSIDNSEA